MTTHPATEEAMMAPLLQWLRRSGRLRDGATVVTELAWCGRRVDLVTVSRTGVATAYELKLRNNARAIEQAALNSRTFERSFVVTMTRPSLDNLAAAQYFGLGVVLLHPQRFVGEVVLRPLDRKVSLVVRRRLRAAVNSSMGGEAPCSLLSRIS